MKGACRRLLLLIYFRNQIPFVDFLYFLGVGYIDVLGFRLTLPYSQNNLSPKNSLNLSSYSKNLGATGLHFFFSSNQPHMKYCISAVLKGINEHDPALHAPQPIQYPFDGISLALSHQISVSPGHTMFSAYILVPIQYDIYIPI